MRLLRLDYVRSYLPVPEMEPEAIRQAAELINGAERPLVLVGQGVELGEASKSFVLSLRKPECLPDALYWDFPHYLRTIR